MTLTETIKEAIIDDNLNQLLEATQIIDKGYSQNSTYQQIEYNLKRNYLIKVEQKQEESSVVNYKRVVNK